MISVRGTLRLRPTRIAFLVNPTDQSAIRKIMRYCACLWGGQFNPIIPVSKRLPVPWRKEFRQRRPVGARLAERYIRFFEPDVFLDTTKDAAKRLGYDEDTLGFQHQRVVSLQGFVAKGDDTFGPFCFGQDVFALYKHLYQTEFKYVQRHKQKFAIFEKSVGPGGTPFFEAVFGMFPEDPQLSHIKQGYIDAFSPDTLKPSYDSFETALRNFVTPLRVANHGIDTDYEDHWDPIVFVLDPHNGPDLLDFWNLRIVRKNILPININWIKESADLIGDSINKNFRPLPRNPHGVMIRTTVEFASSISEDQAHSLVKTHLSGLPQDSFSTKHWYTSLWDVSKQDWYVKPVKPITTAATKDVDLLVDEKALSSWLELLSPDFAARFGQQARWANVLCLSAYVPDSELAFCFPSKKRITDFPKLSMVDRSLVSREGITFLSEHKNERELIHWLKGKDAIIGWLKSHGVEAGSSDAGRTTEELIKAVGGLWGVHLLAHEDTIKKLNEMAGTQTVQNLADNTKVVKKYPDRTAPAKTWQDLLSRRNKKFQTISLEAFTSKNVMRIGLTLKCQQCQEDNWYSLTELDYQLRCQRCLRMFEFPQGTSKHNWHYRVLGAFSVPDYAAGAYGTALTLRLFARGLDSSDSRITYSTGMTLILNNKQMEIDFVLWRQEARLFQESPEPSIVFGEAKSFAAEAFSSRVISNLKGLGQRFPGCFLVASVMKKEFSRKEKQLLMQLAMWGRTPGADGMPRSPLIVLTGNELFFDWSLSHTWEELGGKFAAVRKPTHVNLSNLWTLADLTQQLYLDLPPYGQWLHNFYQKRMGRRRKRERG